MKRSFDSFFSPGADGPYMPDNVLFEESYNSALATERFTDSVAKRPKQSYDDDGDSQIIIPLIVREFDNTSYHKNIITKDLAFVEDSPILLRSKKFSHTALNSMSFKDLLKQVYDYVTEASKADVKAIIAKVGLGITSSQYDEEEQRILQRLTGNVSDGNWANTKMSLAMIRQNQTTNRIISLIEENDPILVDMDYMSNHACFNLIDNSARSDVAYNEDFKRMVAKSREMGDEHTKYLNLLESTNEAEMRNIENFRNSTVQLSMNLMYKRYDDKYREFVESYDTTENETWHRQLTNVSNSYDRHRACIHPEVVLKHWNFAGAVVSSAYNDRGIYENDNRTDPVGYQKLGVVKGGPAKAFNIFPTMTQGNVIFCAPIRHFDEARGKYSYIKPTFYTDSNTLEAAYKASTFKSEYLDLRDGSLIQKLEFPSLSSGGWTIGTFNHYEDVAANGFNQEFVDIANMESPETKLADAYKIRGKLATAVITLKNMH